MSLIRWPGTENLQYWPAVDGFMGATDEVTHFAFSAKKAGDSNGNYNLIKMLLITLLN